MKVVVDADVIIDHLRRSDSIDSQYTKIYEKGYELIMSTVTVAELYSGESAQEEKPQRERLDKILIGIEINSPTLNSAKLVGKLRVDFKLSLGDAFVAALALEQSAPVATFNAREFQKVKHLTLYSYT